MRENKGDQSVTDKDALWFADQLNKDLTGQAVEQQDTSDMQWRLFQYLQQVANNNGKEPYLGNG